MKMTAKELTDTADLDIRNHAKILCRCGYEDSTYISNYWDGSTVWSYKGRHIHLPPIDPTFLTILFRNLPRKDLLRKQSTGGKSNVTE